MRVPRSLGEEIGTILAIWKSNTHIAPVVKDKGDRRYKHSRKPLYTTWTNLKVKLVTYYNVTQEPLLQNL